MIFFSAIILCYNQAPFLKERIDSVINQTYPNFEIIIIDDKSLDNSKAIIEEYRNNKRITNIIYHSENNGSPYGNWPEAVNIAKGDWIWIAEGDDFASTLFLEECEKQIKLFPSSGICYSDSNILNENSGRLTDRYSQRKNNSFCTDKWSSSHHANGKTEVNNFLKYGCTINNISAMVFRKDIALPFIRNTAIFRYYGDWFFCLQMCLSANIGYISIPLNTYRLRSDSFLNAETSLVISKKEYFNILKLLVNHPAVIDKQKLIGHFAYHYLAFGLFKTSPGEKISILADYFKSDKKLAAKITLKIIFIKLLSSRYKKKYELKERHPAA